MKWAWKRGEGLGEANKEKKGSEAGKTSVCKKGEGELRRRKGAEQRANEKHEEEGKNVDKYEIVKRAMKVGMKEGEGGIRGRGRYRLRRRCPRGRKT